MSADPTRKHSLPAAEPVETMRPRSGRRAQRRRSIRVARATREERAFALQRAYELEEAVERPRSRRECEAGPRPCPFVACRHHLYLDVSPQTGTIKLNFPELEVWELSESCALDVAAAGGHGPERTSLLLNVTRERVRQIETAALSKLKNLDDVTDLCDVEPARSRVEQRPHQAPERTK